ncbi:MAG: Uncharacterised protein [Hyphomonas sp. TMED17]|nr:MAG: Uncharacterised protein [Hyphomonas sp. TMED17]
MVLNHIAQRSGLVVIVGPPFEAEIFSHSDLDMINCIAVPERLEQRVGKPQNHKVLNSFFAEIVIDPINLVFGKYGGNAFINFARRVEIGADRFFQNQSHRI